MSRRGNGMKLPRRNFLHLVAGAAAPPAMSRIAWAQAYPSRPVHLLEGFGAGAAPDIIARLIGQALSERLGQSFVVENRAGASSNIAAEAVVRAAPDGYTLFLITSANAVNATMLKLNFDLIHDLAPVASISRAPFVMEVHPSVPANTVAEFARVALHEQEGGWVSYDDLNIAYSEFCKKRSIRPVSRRQLPKRIEEVMITVERDSNHSRLKGVGLAYEAPSWA